MKTLYVSAGGNNTRLKNFLKENFNNIPKHILPLPTKRLTIIETIIENASNHFDRIIIEANSQNIIFISPFFFNLLKVKTVIDNICSGPLGPIIRILQEKKERVYGCAGDYYCNFSWADFENFHNSHNMPVSILVSKSVPTPKGAKFNVNSGKIMSWERVECTSGNELINIGGYIIDPAEKILKAIREITWHKEDVFFDLLIKHGFIGAYDPGGIGFNINTPIIYKSLCHALNQGL